MKFGDLVEYDLRESHGGEIERSYVLGEMSYSVTDEDGPSHVLLGCDKYDGMPIHTVHCKVISSGHEKECLPWRERYLTQWPTGLKPLPRP